MADDIRSLVARGLASDFWKWYITEILEPEYVTAKRNLLQGVPVHKEGSETFAFYQGVYHVLEKLRKNPETWLDMANFTAEKGENKNPFV